MKHIILIGFKNVGKSCVGKLLAHEFGLPFMDSDTVIQERHRNQTGEALSCREIMRAYGEDYFRQLEHEALKEVVVVTPPVVIALGGGAPLLATNQVLLKPHLIVHVTAPKGVIYERIMVNGWPAFFPREVDPYVSFQKIWAERHPIYAALAQVTVENAGSLPETVQELTRRLPIRQPAVS